MQSAATTYQKERKDNAAHKKPLSNVERDGNAAVEIATVVEDLIGPTTGSQHGNGGEDIGDVDKEGLENNDI